MMGLGQLARYRKFLVALAVVLGDVIALGVLHGTAEHYAQLVLSALGAVGVVATPNAKAPPANPPHVPEHAARPE